MLVLSRRRNESVIIGGRVRITILEQHGSRVRIGIEAPEELSVLREELRDRPLASAMRRDRRARRAEDRVVD